MIVGYYKNYLYTTDKVSSEKKKINEESQYMVSHPETGSDSPIGSDQYRGRDRFRAPGFKGFRHIPLGLCSGFKEKCQGFPFFSFFLLFLFDLKDFIGLHLWVT